MPTLERTAKASAEPRDGRDAAYIADSVVVLAGAEVFLSARVTRERGASGLTFVKLLVDGGVIHAAIG
jgi:hypothetical protein